MCQFIPQYMVSEIVKNASAKVAAHFVLSSVENRLAQRENAARAFLGGGEKEGKGERFVHDAESKMSLPGKLVMEEKSKLTDDKELDEAFIYSGQTRDFYKEAFNRNSIDGKGHKLIASVKYGRAYPNAFYNGCQIAFGSGDGKIFQPFTIVDVIGHEWSHGVTDHAAGLIYRNESGALNEHYSDVFGICVKQRMLNQKSKDADWIIGKGIFMPEIRGTGIRNMLKPGTAFVNDPLIGSDRQPDHYDNIYRGPDDGGGVHINSGILNRVFANYAISVGGYAFDQPAKVWYEVLTTKLNPSSNFQNMADALQEVIITRYGTGMEYKALKEALKIVGISARPAIFSQMGL